MAEPHSEETSPISLWYGMMTEMFPDSCLTFLNYGYLDEAASTDWIKTEDLPQRCSLSLIHHLIKDLDVSDKTLLEVGSGRGGNCYYLKRYAQAKKVVGLDFCPAHTQFSIKNHPYEGLSFVTGNALELPFENESFDILINIESSHSYPSLTQFGSEVKRVLRNGGAFIYADVMQSINAAMPLEIKGSGLEFFNNGITDHERMINECGFSVFKEEDISSGVVRALNSKQGHLKHLLRELLEQRQESLPQEAIYGVDLMIKQFDSSLGRALQSEYLRYYYWHLKKIH